MYNLHVFLKDYSHNDFNGIVTVFLSALFADSFLSSFNKWNESNGIEYSIVRVKPEAWIIYPKNNNGVLISDLLKVKYYN
jgi:hypothetical protein